MRVDVYVRISLVATRGVTAQEIERRIPAWRAAIAYVWGERFAVVTGHGRIVPLRIHVAFAADNPHHRVMIRDFAAAHDQLHWSLRATPEIIAHEFGHLLGAFDEYRGGGTAPGAAVIDQTSIMGTPQSEAGSVARHLWLVRETMAQAWQDGGFSIMRVDQVPRP